VLLTALTALHTGCKKPGAGGAPDGGAASQKPLSPSEEAALRALENIGDADAPPRPAKPAKPAVVLPEGPILQVLYKGKFLGQGSDYASLVGARPAAQQASVREGSGLVQTFDYKGRAVVEQWQQVKDRSGAIDPSDEAKLEPELRWAEVVRSQVALPKYDGRPWGRVVMSPDGRRALYEGRGATPLDGGNTLARVMLADAKGGSVQPSAPPKTLANVRELPVASVDVVTFSPDSRMVAWTAGGRVPTYPHGGVRAGEPVLPSEVFVADVSDAAEVKTRHLTRPNELLRGAVWSRDGARLFLLSTSEYGVGKACLLEADPKRLDAVREVACPPGFSVILKLTMAPDGRTAVLHDSQSLVWIDLTTGKVKKELQPEQVTLGDLRLSSNGIIVTGAAREGIVILDLESGREARIKPAAGYYGGLDSARWLDERRLALLHQGKGVEGFELIGLDVVAVLGP